MTVIVLTTLGLYEVMLLIIFGSPSVSSTPGGTERGVRPSLEGRGPVVENCRAAVVAAVDCHAGIRKLGNEAAGDDATRIARPSAAFFVGINIADVGIACRRKLPCSPMAALERVAASDLNFLVAYSSVTCTEKLADSPITFTYTIGMAHYFHHKNVHN